jgi:hypothetical protein
MPRLEVNESGPGATTRTKPPYRKVSIYWPAVLRFVGASTWRIAITGLVGLFFLGLVLAAFNWLSRAWDRGGPAYSPPAFPLSELFFDQAWSTQTNSSFPTYWGIFSKIVFHASSSENLYLKCPTTRSKYLARVPAFKGDFFGTFGEYTRLSAPEVVGTTYVNINLSSEQFALSSEPDFTISLTKPADGGGIYQRIEAGSDHYYCLDAAMQPAFAGEDNPYRVPRYYCAAGFDPKTKEYRRITIGEPSAEVVGTGYRRAEITVDSGACQSFDPKKP